MLFFWTFYSLKNSENHDFQKMIKQHNYFNIYNNNNNRNVSWAVNQYIRTISEGLCGSKDSNRCWTLCFAITGISYTFIYCIFK